MAPVALTLPSFFVIGAPKAGTTSLHFYLDQHPEIAMTSVKEPFVFCVPEFRERLERYRGLFQAEAPARGESTTVYSQYPHYGDVATRIRSVVPDARFVYVVRDPIERAVAHYRQHVLAGKESRPLDTALADFEDPASAYVCASRYRTQLEAYLAHYEPGRVLVLDQGDLLEHRDATLAEAFGFLGVDPSFRSPAFDDRLNRAEDHRLATGLGQRLGGMPGKATVRRLPIPAVVRRPARRLVSRPVKTPILDPTLRSRIADSLRDEVAWLREFSGRTFAGWSV